MIIFRGMTREPSCAVRAPPIEHATSTLPGSLMMDRMDTVDTVEYLYSGSTVDTCEEHM